MGYTTYFFNAFEIKPKLTKKHKNYLIAFAQSRRMKRNANIEEYEDPLRKAVKLPVGLEGAYYVNEVDDGVGLQMSSCRCVTDVNKPPIGQPGLWCHWSPSDDGRFLEWDNSEKFYKYTEWLAYLIEHFFEPWGYKLSGSVIWQGEESDDRGTIYCQNNRVEAVADIITNPGPSWQREQERAAKAVCDA